MSEKDIFAILKNYEEADIKKLDEMVIYINKCNTNELNEEQVDIISKLYARYFTESATLLAKELEVIANNNKHDKNTQYASYNVEYDKFLFWTTGVNKESIKDALDKATKSTGESFKKVGDSIKGLVINSQLSLRMQEANIFLNKLTPAINERIFHQLKEERILLEKLYKNLADDIDFTDDKLIELKKKYKGDMSEVKNQLDIVKDLENKIYGIYKLEKQINKIEYDFEKEKELNEKQEKDLNEFKDFMAKYKHMTRRLKVYLPAYIGLACGVFSLLMQLGVINL